MKYLDIGSLKIPRTAATKSFALLAKRGAGKTYTGAVMAEEFYKVNIPFVVFDPIDVWWGLRYDADGKKEGLPIVVFGISHADIPLDRDMGRKIAQAIVKENVSCIISTKGIPKVGQRHLIAEFAEELLNINNTPRHVFIEEAHEFVPQRVFGGLAKCFSAVESLVVMGRNCGLGVTLINQRAATLNKDVLTQVDSLLAFRNIAPQDRKALKEWVEAHSAEGDFKMFMDSLPSLPTGEGWIWSPEFLKKFQRIKIRKRRTFHPDPEKLGKKFEVNKLKQNDVKSFVELFSKKPEKIISKSKVGQKLIRSLTEADIKKALAPHITAFRSVEQGYKNLIKQWEKYTKDLLWMIDHLGITAKKAQRPSSNPGVSYNVNVDKPDSNKELAVIKIDEEIINIDSMQLGRCAGMIYSFLLKQDDPIGKRSFNKRQIAAATGYSIRSSGFSNAISSLVSKGLVKRKGDKIEIALVDRKFAKYLEHDFSIRGWLNNLGKCPREIYEFLLEHPNETFTKEQIADNTPSQYSVTSSGFTNALSALNSTGLITKEGSEIRLNPELLELNQ